MKKRGKLNLKKYKYLDITRNYENICESYENSKLQNKNIQKRYEHAHTNIMKKILSQKKYLLLAKIIFSILIFALPISFSNFSKNFIKQASAADPTCEVLNIVFNQNGTQGEKEWYKPGKKVSLSADLKNCNKQTIKFSLTELDMGLLSGDDDLEDINGLPEDIPITIPTGAQKIKFDFLAGEEKGGGEIPEVIMYATFYDTKDGTKESIKKDETFTYEDILPTAVTLNQLTNLEPVTGYLAYNCDGVCMDNWSLTDMIFYDKPAETGTIIFQPIKDGKIGLDANGILDPGTIKEINGDQKDVQDAMEGKLSCGLGIWGNGSFAGCVAGLLEIIGTVTAYLAVLGATVLDFFIGYSLSDVSYRSEFVTKGWTVTRDIANLFFIFILLYAAIKTIIEGAAKSGTKKMITNVIVVALLINFSLFMTRVIIDATNILARVFYNQIEVKGDPIVAVEAGGETTGKMAGTKPVSIALVNNFNPQNLSTDVGLNESTQTGLYLLLLVIIIFVNITMFSVFLSVGIFFLGRVIGLWVAMVFAPLAFISYALPKGAQEKMQDIGWNSWLKELINMAIMAPVFIFFLYLILLIGNLNNIITVSPDASAIQNIMKVIIPFIIIISLLKKAKEMAASLAGKVGTQLMGAISKAAGTVMSAIPIAGAVAGGAIMGGGKIVAGVGKLAGKGGELAEKKGFGMLGKGLKKFGTGAEAVGKAPTKATQAVGKFMGENKYGQAIGTTFGLAGKLAGAGLAKFEVPGLEKLGGAAGMLGAGFLKPGAALGTAMGMKPEEMGAMGRMGYRNEKEREEDAIRTENDKKKKIQKKMSTVTDDVTKEKSEKEKKKYDEKSDEIRKTETEKENSKIDEDKDKKIKDVDDKKEKDLKDAESKTNKKYDEDPEYQKGKTAKNNQGFVNDIVTKNEKINGNYEKSLNDIQGKIDKAKDPQEKEKLVKEKEEKEKVFQNFIKTELEPSKKDKVETDESAKNFDKKETERKQEVETQKTAIESKATTDKAEIESNAHVQKAAKQKEIDDKITQKLGSPKMVYNTTAERNADVMKKEIEKLKGGNVADQKLADKFQRESSYITQLRDDKTRTEEQLTEANDMFDNIGAEITAGGGQINPQTIKIKITEKAIPLKIEIETLREQQKDIIKEIKTAYARGDTGEVTRLSGNAAKIVKDLTEKENHHKLLVNLPEKISDLSERAGTLHQKLNDAQKKQAGKKV